MKENLIVLLIGAVVIGFILFYMEYRSENPTPNDIVFMKYPGSKICFATTGWGTNTQTMATVPCEDVPAGKLHSFEGQ